MNVQVGDKVVNTDQHCIYCGVIGFVKSCDEISNRVLVAETKSHGHFWLKHESYEVLEDTDVPEVGDTIIITSERGEPRFHKTFVVVGIDGELIGVAHTNLASPFVWLGSGDYQILKRNQKAPAQTCLDCNGTGKIQLFTSTVRCKCNV